MTEISFAHSLQGCLAEVKGNEEMAKEFIHVTYCGLIFTVS